MLLRDVSKIYQSSDGTVLTALQDITLSVRPGEFASVVGPSGCGKSTLLRLIAGLDRPSRGDVLLAGAPVIAPIPSVGIVFQDPLLMPWRTVLDNVMLPIEVLRLSDGNHRAQALELLTLVGLKGFERRYPRELSGGMQQRAAIARALIHNPPLLLMDEPFGALDEITREQMGLEVLRIWNETRKTIVFITHSIAESVFLSDRVVVMSPRPGVVRANIVVDLPRPRDATVRGMPRYVEHCQEIRGQLGLMG
ncbi:MAG: ABC transporter ATP-binding protein [Burkholderiales bacterium]|nr:ABC transporter ATP-binding protein [Burkholderiales bacterium]